MYDYGLHMYGDLSYGGSRFNTFGKGLIKMRTITFPKWADQLLETAVDRSMVRCLVWIVPDLSSGKRCVNQGRCLPEDEKPESKKLQRKRRDMLSSNKPSLRSERHL